MEIVRERLEREYDLDLVATAPSVAYQVTKTDGSVVEIKSPQDLPEPTDRQSISEPYVRAMILTPTEYVGPIMELVTNRRGEVGNMNYLSSERVELDYKIPLGEVVFDFFDLLKSKTKGYASLDYEPAGYRVANLVKVDILLNGQAVDAFSAVVHRDKAEDYGKTMTGRLRKLIPRQLFDVPIQAAIGGKIISRETVKATRKDVTAKCYGGDISRKKKLLQRQKEGKKRMKMVGSVEVPQEAFVAALRVDDE
jgi:GTP-binding protein LepA